MKKKEKNLKRKLKKNNKQGKEKLKKSPAANESLIQGLTDKIKKLKADLKQRDDVIADLQKQLKKSARESDKSEKKNKRLKAIGSATKLLRTQQTARIGVTQRQSWKRHGFLRDRYEFHLESGQEKTAARVMANQDLMDAYGEESGYSEQELEDILS